MGVPSIPDKFPRWATGGGAAIVEPSEAKKDLGWIAEKPPHDYFNWLLKFGGLWDEYHKQIVPRQFQIENIATDLWIEQSNPKNFNLRAVANNGQTLCAVGDADGTDAYIVVSTDGGKTWTESANPKNFGLRDIKWDGSQFVAVGDADGTDSYIITSPTGASGTWTEQAPTVSKNFTLLGLTVGFINGAKLLVAVGQADGTDAYILTSPDGVTWTERSNPKNFFLSQVTWNGSVFVAVGEPDGTDAYIVTSPDGTTWTEQSNPRNIRLTGISWNGLIFCAVGFTHGTGAYIITSSDGSTWTDQANPEDEILNSICSSRNLFVAVGNADGVVGSYTIISADGETWTKKLQPVARANEDLYGICHSGDKFVAVGKTGASGPAAYIATSRDVNTLGL